MSARSQEEQYGYFRDFVRRRHPIALNGGMWLEEGRRCWLAMLTVRLPPLHVTSEER